MTAGTRPVSVPHLELPRHSKANIIEQEKHHNGKRQADFGCFFPLPGESL